MKKAGMRAVYVPSARVTHRIPAERLTPEAYEDRWFVQGICDSFTHIRDRGGELSQKLPGYDERPVPADMDPAKAVRFRVMQRARNAYTDGYCFHQAAVQKSPSLLSWVLKKDYFEYAFPQKEVERDLAKGPYSIDYRARAPETDLDARLRAHAQSGAADRAGTHHAETDHAQLCAAMAALGITVREVEIDAVDFERWRAVNTAMECHYERLGDVRIEKLFEHYLTERYAAFDAGKTVVDVAASGSPWADVLAARGVDAYRLDLAYPKGIRGREIGADAAATGLPDAFADALLLHCAYECFAGDADVRFWKEAERVLKPGGSVVIAPLYLCGTHLVETSLCCPQEGIPIDAGAIKVWRDDEYAVPFCRFYSAHALAQRVFAAGDGLRKEVLVFRGLESFAARYPGQRVYCRYVLTAKKEF
jgi:SAM-dependent methyltransferase